MLALVARGLYGGAARANSYGIRCQDCSREERRYKAMFLPRL